MNAFFELCSVARGALMFHLRSRSGEVLLSSRVHRAHTDLLDAIEQLRHSAVLPSRFLCQDDADGTCHFVVHGDTGEAIAKSEIHSMAWARNWAIEEVMRHAPHAVVLSQKQQQPTPATG